MAEIIKTTFEQYVGQGGGTFRISDTTEYDDLKVLSIMPESDSTVDILTIVGPDGVEFDGTASLASGGRNLTTLKANIPYSAGANSYFKTIKLSAGEISCNKF